MIGQTLSHYKIVEKIADGGMGVVYRALDVHLDRSVAIKVLRPETTSDLERKHRFVQEAKTASALNHPNIVAIYDINTANGVDFIAMEYVQGKTLDHLIGRKGLPLNQLLKFGTQIADAVASAHSAGLIHRDLKPSNLIVSDSGLVKVLDFGLAKLVEPHGLKTQTSGITQIDAPAVTQQGTIVGTAAYMSPEQAEGKKLDARSDIFSMGTVLYEMLTGQRPFHGDTPISTITAILREEPQRVSKIAQGIPREIERIISRCLRKDPDRRFQTMSDLRVALLELKEESDSGILFAGATVSERPVRKRLAALLAAAMVLVLIVIGLIWLLPLWKSVGLTLILTRLTSDSGLTTDVAISRDGKLIAYASDRGGEGNLDIYVQQVAGREPVRLTRHEADDREPCFSPDGTKVVYRSERKGGALYVVPALGGEERLIAENGYQPRFSPDGNMIAYWVGERHLPTGRIYTVSVAGGPAEQLVPEFTLARGPIWSPEGRRLLFVGRPDSKAPPEEDLDWWITPVDGGKAIATGAFAQLRSQGLSPGFDLMPGDWVADENGITFSAGLGDSTSLWQLGISRRSGMVSESLRRITFGTGHEAGPSVASDGRMVFSSLNESIDIWSQEIDANQGRTRAGMQRLTQSGAGNSWAYLSREGNKVAFVSRRSGDVDVWLRDLQTGKEISLSHGRPVEESFPLVSQDGSRVAFAITEGQKQVVYIVPVGGGIPEKVCDDCGRLTDWSPDGKYLFFLRGEPLAVGLLDITSREKRTLLSYPGRALYGARWSPDGRWVVFHSVISSTQRQVYVVPFPLDASSSEKEWIKVTDGTGLERNACWSPDGVLLYFLSERDGFRCIWAQRLERETKKRAGSMFPVVHFHRARTSLSTLNPGSIGLSVAPGRLIFAQHETTGNIWMASPR